MCGICGQFNFTDNAPVQRRDVERMTQSIVHRGPDDEGYFISGSLGFGFRRLSIIDLAGGHQPMSDQDQTVWVIFNGEIYNFPELKSELESFGHRFRTTCDTEVIVHGYKQWGKDVFNRLNGMFGVAIWDTLARRLIIARDPFGIKLIYYKVKAGRLYFGSEIRPLLTDVSGKVDIDIAALNLFLRYRYTPSPYTMYEGVRKLAPGTMLVCEDGTCKVERWYQSKPVPFSPMKSDDEAVEELTELYKRSMKRHLLSDVPVGLLLSGGVDSGLLLALMNLYGKSWKTYTVGYGSGFKYDELKDASDTAAMLGADHTSVPLDRKTFEKSLPGIVSSLEEPIASSSIVPMYFVCERARQDVKVALIGQGPDELFGGYRRHWGVRYGAYWERLPAWVRAPLAATVNMLPRNEMLKRGVYALDIPERMKRYEHVLSLMPGHQVDGLFQKDLGSDTDNKLLECWQDLIPLSSELDELGGFQFFELRSTLPDELLMFADKLSMAHSLEVRVPFLDKEIVEYVERLGAKFKVRNGFQKWLHRQVCKKMLPSTILRRRKRGFNVLMVDEWFRSAVGSKLEDTLMDGESLIYQYLSAPAVQAILKQHKTGENDNHKLLFSVVMLEEWLRIHAVAPNVGDMVAAV